MAPEPIPSGPKAPKASPKAAPAPAKPAGAEGPAPRLPGDALALKGAVEAARATWTFERPIETEGSSFAPTVANRRHVAKRGNEDASTEARAILEAQRPGQKVPFEEVWALKAKVGRDDRAAKEVAANFAIELKASKALPGDQPAAYARVAHALKGEPMARLGLQKLLLNGELPGQAAHGGASMLAMWDRLLATPLAEGLSGSELVAATVLEIAEPTAIQQGWVRTCTATSLQIDLAMRWPAEYLRLVAGLASPKGEVATASGAKLQREPFAKYSNDRSASSRLFQDAVIELGNGPEKDYDPNTDSNLEAKPSILPFPSSGLGTQELSAALQAIWGEKADFVPIEEDVVGAQACLGAAKACLAGGRNVPAAFTWAEEGVRGIQRARSGHQVLLIGHGAEGFRIANPHGAEQLMKEDDFLKRIRDVHVPKALVPKEAPPKDAPPPLGPRPPEWKS